MQSSEKFLVEDRDVGTRLDKLLSQKFPEKTRSSLQKIIEDGGVAVKGEIANKNYKLRFGDEVEITLPNVVELDVKPQDIPLDIVYEDNDLLVINKQKGMVVHPAAGNFDGTLVNALLYHCKDSLSGINGVIRPGIVHRIDKDTSGLLVVAKNDVAHVSLAAQIKEHSFTRTYEAVVHSVVKKDSGEIDAPIGRAMNDRKKMCVTERNAKHAVTHFEVIKRYEKFTHIKLRLETGRTHQIRVHMAYMGYPVAGDEVYGPKKAIKSLNGQCLHAKTIGFIHPVTGEYMHFESELPAYFTSFLKTLH
ncbi:MAG: RluA family pseudouridine synthase [Oscillospiraceae bacterium]|jgi:23S rRNA pseudouridine1911/1915/1917 synthase|nr:RluA family pseudouridine synthase [Oscillospiraceae bacterium]